MDWAKVVTALDDEWDRHKQMAETLAATQEKDRDRHRLLANIAFMLRDCLKIGLET